jgi:hypothetical protein
VPKFVPFSTPYNNAIPNAEDTYTSLIHEQTQFLKEHVGIPVGGLSYEAMQYSPKQGMALDSILYYTKLFTALKPTSLVNKSGKWIFCTTQKKSSEALEYIENRMPTAYQQVPAEFRGSYLTCPTPRRLTRSPIRKAYIINLVTNNPKAVPTSSHNANHGPRQNAWRAGPPSNLRSDINTASHESTKGSLSSTQVITALDEHREEVNIHIGQMHTSIQKFTTKTGAQFASLTQQLEAQITRIQLNTTSTQAAIQSSPALSAENLNQLKCDIISELTPVIQSAVDNSIPQLIRQHLDATLGPAIQQALLALQAGASANLNLLGPLNTPLEHTPTGFSPRRKAPRTLDNDPMATDNEHNPTLNEPPKIPCQTPPPSS